MNRPERGMRCWTTGTVLALLLAGTPLGTGGQSLLGAGGLGVPLDPVNGRARALGGVGVGLPGTEVLPADPAAAADLALPAITFTFQPSWVDVESGSTTTDASGTRFPVIGIAYPVSDLGVALLSFGSVLDQRWEVEIGRLIDLGEEEARVTDTFVSDGGVSSLRAGFARRISPSVAVGLTVGSHLGSLNRRFTRSFDSLSVATNVPPFSVEGSWSFSAPTVAASAQVDVGDFLRVAGSVIWSGDLTADPDDETGGVEEEFDFPTQYRVGASGSLAPGLNATLGITYADWSGSGDAVLVGGGGTSTFGVGTGLEVEEVRLLGMSSPLRLGYRHSDFPFRFEGEEASEDVWGGGLGLVFGGSGGNSLARVDLTLELGDREAGALSESFWRATISLRVAGL